MNESFQKSWRIILGVVVVSLIIGGVCIGVGVLTGADRARIIMQIEERYHLSMVAESYLEYLKSIPLYLKGVFGL